MTTLEQINAILNEACNKKLSITETTDLLEEKILDSLDTMVFFMMFEEKFGIKIPEDVDLKAEGYFKVEKLIKMVEIIEKRV